MLELLKQWYRRRFSDPQAIALLIILVGAFCIIYFFNGLLAPLLVALVIAYLLEWPTARLERLGCTRTWAASLIMLLFAGIVLILTFVVVPVAWQQGINLTHDLPNMLNNLYRYAMRLPERFPTLMDVGIIDIVVNDLRSRLSGLGEQVVKYSLASLVGLVTLAIYLVLVPIMVFFLLKDREQLWGSVLRILPRNRGLADQVWFEMNQQITNYIRGKVVEMVVVGIATWLGFVIVGMNYALLLAVLVGASVLIPYVGAVVSTIPVICVGLFQWGPGGDFWTMLAIYLIIQGLDGNLLVPVLFSEAVNLHPLVIMMSVVVFGDMWGFWGVFFAIPLATLIKAVMHAWPDEAVSPTLRE